MSRLSRLVSLSRESETIIGDEEALNDASVHTDIVTDVEMPADDFVTFSDEIQTAKNDAVDLEKTAELINETSESDDQGVSPLSASLVQEKIETAIEKYQLQMYVRTFSRESFNTASSRREVSRQLAREAEEASKGIWQRIKDSLRAAMEWLKNLFKKWLTAHGRLHRRIKALKEKYAKAETEVNPSRVEMNASRLGNTDIAEEVDKLDRFLSSNPMQWFSFTEYKGFLEFTRKAPETFKHRIELFEKAGGDLGGKRVGLHVRDQDSDNFSIEVKDFSSELKKYIIKGVTKEEGKKLLDKLDKLMSRFDALKKFNNKLIFTLSAMSGLKMLEDNDDPSFKDKLTVIKRVIPYAYSVKKASAIALSTSLKVASVATEVCAKSIGPAKEKE